MKSLGLNDLEGSKESFLNDECLVQGHFSVLDCQESQEANSCPGTKHSEVLRNPFNEFCYVNKAKYFFNLPPPLIFICKESNCKLPSWVLRTQLLLPFALLTKFSLSFLEDTLLNLYLCFHAQVLHKNVYSMTTDCMSQTRHCAITLSNVGYIITEYLFVVECKRHTGKYVNRVSERHFYNTIVL